MSNYDPILTYVIKAQSNTHKSLLKELANRDEFAINIIEDFYDGNMMDYLKKNVRNIILNANKKNAEYVLICKDDHEFCSVYSKEILYQSIQCAKDLNADMLFGGLERFKSTFRISKNIFWVEDFSGLPLTIVFRSFYEKILSSTEGIFPFTNTKFFIYPFISKEFEVSEVISINGEIIKTRNSDVGFSDQINIIEKVSAFYEEKLKNNAGGYNESSYDNISIPTYIINLAERFDRLEHIKKQFAERHEFEIKIVEACKNSIGAVGLWESIRKVIKMAIEEDEDVVIICEDDHEFTADYSKSLLLKNIVEAHEHHTEILSGGICWFDRALPITSNRAWVSTSYCTQFIILYKRIFEKILNEPYDNTITADGMFTKILSNKMVFFPFISLQKDFGYSDISAKNIRDTECQPNLFDIQIERLKRIYEAKAAYLDGQLLR